MTKEQRSKILKAIKLINNTAKFKIAPSPINGVGVFAMRDIKEGELLEVDAIPQAFDIPYKDFNKLRPEIAEIILGQHPQIINGSHFIYPTTRFLTYMNHSKNPNYDNKTDKALRDIAEGEEITEDYTVVENYQKVYPWLKN
jgi:SET domain-containing protein